MTSFLPAYRATVYAPRSADLTETTVLVPAANAPHAEPFRVASMQGIAGYAPLLGFPEGRRGAVDPLTKRTDTGELVLSLLDRRTGSSNSARWLTAFTGDAQGRPALLGCKVKVEESLDHGATWTGFFVGRVQDFTLDESAITGTLIVRDYGDELAEVPLFRGAPHASLAFATPAPLWPLAPLGKTATMPATANRNGSESWCVISNVGNTITQGNILSKPLTALADFAGEDPATGLVGTTVKFNRSQVLALVSWGAGSGYYRVSWMLFGPSAKDRSVITARTVAIRPLGAGEVGYAPLPPHGASVTVRVVANTTASKESPLYLWNVHPVTLWRSILEGKLSPLTDSGAVRQSFAYDAGEFAALEADATFLPGRWLVSEGATLSDWVEENILKPYNLAARIDGAGVVHPVDCRRTNALTSAPAIDETEAAGGAAGLSWKQELKGAATYFTVTLYRDSFPTGLQEIEKSIIAGGGTTQSTPFDVKGGLVETVENLLIDRSLDLRSLDFGTKEVKIDGFPFRYSESDLATSSPMRATDVENAALTLTRSLRALLGAGVVTYARSFRRVGVARDTYPGMWRRVTIAEAPNAASNLRGGVRLALCTDRIEDGPNVGLTFIDAGAASVASTPTLGALTLSGNVPSVSVTLNAAGDPVAVQYCLLTSATSVTPGDSASWREAGAALVSGALALPAAPGGVRVFVRARSESLFPLRDVKLPSQWTTPSPAYVDVAALAAPTGLAVSSIAKTAASLSWTNASTVVAVEVFVKEGAAPGDWTPYLVARLTPGSTRYRLRGIAGPSVAHAVAVRHRDGFGATSAVAACTFTTGTIDAALPRPAGIDLALPVGGSQ